MATANKELTASTYAKDFAAFMETAESAKQEYARLFSEMIDALSIQHFEKFSTILKEKEKVIPNQEKFLQMIKQKFLRTLITMQDNTWENIQIAEKIALLEMMKQKYKDSPEVNWRTHETDAQMRTLPLRMRYKEAQLRYLKKQLICQNSKLNNLMTVTLANRDQVRKIEIMRRFTIEQMERGTEQLQNLKSDYPKLVEQVLYYPMGDQHKRQQHQQQDRKEKED